MKVQFTQKRIKKNATVGRVMDIFQESFATFRKKFPNEISEHEQNAIEVGKEDARGVRAVILRSVNSSAPGFFRKFIDEMTNDEQGIDYVLTDESFELSPDEHRYYKLFASDLREKFILSSGFPACTTYDDANAKFPDGESGLILLIEELLRRIVARILSHKSKCHGKELIDIVLSGFIQQISRGGRVIEIACGLKTDGTSCISFFSKDDKITPAGHFLAHRTQIDASTKSETIYDEIRSLTTFVDSFEKSQSFTIAIESGLDACDAEATSLRQRIVVGLQYLLDSRTETRVFPTELLNEGALSHNINRLVSKLRQKFKLAESSGSVTRDETATELQDEVINNVENLIHDLSLLVSDCPTVFDHKTTKLVEMIRANVTFEHNRRVLFNLFYNLHGCREAMGFLFVLSGALNADSLKRVITNYLSKGSEVRNTIPQYLRSHGNISEGARGCIWSVVDNRWEDVSSAITMMSDPRVQRRLAKEAITKLQALFQINQKLHDFQCLMPGEDIIDTECLTPLIKGLKQATSGNPHLYQLGAPDVVSDSLQDRRNVAFLSDRTGNTSAAVAGGGAASGHSADVAGRAAAAIVPSGAAASVVVVKVAPVTTIQAQWVARINLILVEYAFAYGYKFNLDIDPRVQCNGAQLCMFPNDSNHEKRALWIFSFLSILNNTEYTLQNKLTDLQDLLVRRTQDQTICTLDHIEGFSVPLSNIRELIESLSKKPSVETVQTAQRVADFNDKILNATGETAVQTKPMMTSTPVAGGGASGCASAPHGNRNGVLVPSAEVESNVASTSLVEDTVAPTASLFALGQGAPISSVDRGSFYVDKESFGIVYTIQTLLGEHAQVLPAKVTEKDCEELRQRCEEVQHINLRDFSTPAAPNFHETLFKAVFVPYRYEATVPPIWYRNFKHAGWEWKDLYLLRYHYSKFVEVFKGLRDFHCAENRKEVKTPEEVKQMQESMINNLLAAFLRKMLRALPEKDYKHYTEARRLFVDVGSGSEIVLIDEGDNGLVGKYRVADSLMSERNKVLEARMMTLIAERDTYQSQLIQSEVRSSNLQNENDSLKETNARNALTIDELRQEFRLFKVQLEEQFRSFRYAAPATAASHGLFVANAGPGHDAQLQPQSETTRAAP